VNDFEHLLFVFCAAIIFATMLRAKLKANREE
jgi:hypothetical protein